MATRNSDYIGGYQVSVIPSPNTIPVYNPSGQLPASAIDGLIIDIQNETPVGIINSTTGYDGNGQFVLQNDIKTGNTPDIIISGYFVPVLGVHFTFTAPRTIDFISPYRPIIGDFIKVNYTKA